MGDTKENQKRPAVRDIQDRIESEILSLTRSGCKDQERYRSVLEPYADDSRTSVGKLLEREEKRIAKLMAEYARLKKMNEFENKYADLSAICGIDEVGRGPLAGPVVACAVILPKNTDILSINDSKQLSEKKREELFVEIMSKAVSVGTGCISHDVIDKVNILQATFLAMKQAVENLSAEPDILLVDAVHIPDVPYRQVGIVKGDARSVSIAAASIVAKVTRDHMMQEYDRLYPGYGFAANKGYGSEAHMKALAEKGPCPIHRKTFIRNLSVKAADGFDSSVRNASEEAAASQEGEWESGEW